MSSILPLGTSNCRDYEKKWTNISLDTTWKNCIEQNNFSKDSTMTDEEKKKQVTQVCCQQVLQCTDPNEWLKSKGYSGTCQVSQEPDRPHFGNIKVSDYIAKINLENNERFFGVF